MTEIAIFEEVFDSCPQQGEGGGPEFHTTIQVLGSGHERANQDWEASRFRGDLGNKTVSEAQKNYILAFFQARRGRAQPFLYKDWTDFKATDEELNVFGDATVQLTKTYEPNGNAYVRNIVKPKEGTVTLKIDGQPFTEFEVDYTTGILTFDTDIAPDSDNVVTWSGEFYIPVRFDTDVFRANPVRIREDNIDRNFYTLGPLPIIGKRLD